MERAAACCCNSTLRSLPAASCLSLLESVFTEDGLQLLRVPNEDDEGARIQLAYCRLHAAPHLGIDLGVLIQDDEVVVPKASWWVVLLVLVSGHLERSVDGFDGDEVAWRQAQPAARLC